MTNAAVGAVHRPVLATDLDGTLIPLVGDEQNQQDVALLATQLAIHDVSLVFVTGRHFASVLRAKSQWQLPSADWLICDVGTSIFQRQASGHYVAMAAYQLHLEKIIAALPLPALRERLASLDGLVPQEPEKQGRFKLSYYVDAARLDELVAGIQRELDTTAAPYSIIHSVDPFNGDGLIDLLPAQVSKAHALAWWVRDQQLHPDQVVFAGDSGNDLAALTAGYRSILVGNADRQLARQVYDAHRQAGWMNRLYLARTVATSGLLEGCRWFGLAEREPLPITRLGATPVSEYETHFRVWAPSRKTVAVDLLGEHPRRHALQREEGGYFCGVVPHATSGPSYQYVLDNQTARPDPASSFQPAGVHGASRIVDHRAFAWTDQDWRGVPKRELVIYELHVGAFTEEGTLRAALGRLPQLVELGVTAVELMPVAQSPGRWNWGYDGVDLFAVRNTYGAPDDFKEFVNSCHAAGIAVILDVVYNHLGPEGNYLAEFGPYFSRKHRTPWGEAFNFDGRHRQPIRRFVIDNAIHWLHEYHLDGLRLDAVHFMVDDSQPTILDEIRRAVTDYSATARRTLHLIAEANIYDRALLSCDTREQPGYDAIWCDCLMHAIYSHAVPDLRLTHREYRGANDLAETLRCGYIFAGTSPERASPEERAADRRQHIDSFITALQTHDSVGNHPHGKRLHQLTSVAFQKAAAGLTLLFPSIPLLFMGEEVAVDAPFPFFVDFEDERLRRAADEGRAREYPQHVWRGAILPSDANAFYVAKCHDRRRHDTEMASWYRDLLALRKQGLAQGWLTAEGMSSSHDPERNIFSITFADGERNAVSVNVRLTPVGQNATPVRIERPGTVLLSSLPNFDGDNGALILQPNHAVILRESR